jgi:uncharacterized protein (TIGR02598 family)
MKNSTAISRRHFLEIFARKSCAFSLVEVVVSLGIFSFAVLSIVCLMATGLGSAKDSNTNLVIANITRNLRANLQAMPYSSLVSGTPITYYFTDSGFPTATPSTCFYTVVMTPGVPVYPSGATSQNAYVLAVNISFPYPANANAITSSLFVAR